MFDEIFIKEMSPIDAYNYGRQMMEKELNEIHLCECNQIRAEAEEDAENRMSRILDDEKRLAYEQGRNDAIDEFVKAFKDNMLKSTTPTWTCYVDEIAEKLKEQK